MSNVFKALADDTRRDIMLMLAKEHTSVNEIAEQFSMSRPAISRHIKVLREASLVYTKPDELDGRQINCYAQLEALKEVEDYMSKLEAFWKNRLKGLGKFLDDQQNDRKNKR